jgi:nitroimidazol reductase NimA-like FMN-containing flavoprotein (pyridoxamine 5'-phosphate oxidase superfamily)
MTPTLARDEILARAADLARAQYGGTLATTHAEDGTPYVTYVLFHLRRDGILLFGSAATPQHSRNIHATPEVSFLIDNREVISRDWTAFDRIVIEGRAVHVHQDDPRYTDLVGELAAKNRMAAWFTEHGQLFCIYPRRLILMHGLEGVRHIVDFEHEH